MRKRSGNRRVTYGGDNHGIRRATYSKRKVYCPNASTSGFGRYEARPGDLVEWRYPSEEGGARHLGRVLGRVDAHACSAEIPAVVENIAVVELAMVAEVGFVRWLEPAWVMQVRSPEEAAKFVAWFFAKDWDGEDVERTLRLSNRGSLSGRYIEQVKDCEECGELLSIGDTCHTAGCSVAERREAEEKAWYEKAKAERLAEREAEARLTAKETP